MNKIPDGTVGFLAGIALAAGVAWYNWPAPLEAAVRAPDREIRAHRELQLSPTETVRAVVVPSTETISSFVCVIYRDSQSGQTLMTCPDREYFDLSSRE